MRLPHGLFIVTMNGDNKIYRILQPPTLSIEKSSSNVGDIDHDDDIDDEDDIRSTVRRRVTVYALSSRCIKLKQRFKVIF